MANQRDKMTDDGHMSYSQLSEFAQCPRKFYYHRVEKIPALPVYALVSGKAVHAGLEAHNIERIRGARLTAKDIIEVGAETIRSDPTLDEVEGRPRGDVIDRFARETGPAVISYLDDVEPGIADQTIVGVEEEVNFTLEGVPFVGFVDLHTDAGVWDYKLTERKKSEKEVRANPQLYLYRAALKSGRAGLVCLMRGRADAQFAEQPYAAAMEAGVLDWARSIVRGIQTARQTGVWTRADPTHYACGVTCPFYFKCFKE